MSEPLCEPWITSGCSRRPRTIQVVGDDLRADRALHLASEGVGLLWRGDFRNARQLLDAMKRRIDRRPTKPGRDASDTFYRYRQARAHRARILGMVLVELDADSTLYIPNAPDVRAACQHAYGEPPGPGIVSLRELLGVVGAYEWHNRGVYVPALGATIHPHYGVFAPTRGEYVDLVNEAPLPPGETAFDIGTGTGVLAAVLARRGLRNVVACDDARRAVECATDNMHRLGYTQQVTVTHTDLFPDGQADLVVCNPPWLPGKPGSLLDTAIYDRGSRMLRALIQGIPRHLTEDGQAWLVLSDFAELLGLRTRGELLGLFDDAGLAVLGRSETTPRHAAAFDETRPLASARASERTSLWRLGHA